MFLLLFILLQSQQPRLSPFVIAAAVLAFITGIALLVYFFRRFKASEKEAEEDWSVSRRSLFVSPEPAEQKAEEVATEEVAAAEPAQPERIDPAPIIAEPVNQAATEMLGSIRTGEIHEVKNEQPEREPRATEELRADYFQALDASPAEVPVREEEPAQALSNTEDEATPFDDDIWAGLETDKQQTAQHAPPAELERSTQLLGSDSHRPPIEWPSTQQANEPARDARVDSSTRLEQFEPPVIKPLKPREQSTFIETRGDSSQTQDLYAASPLDKKSSTSEPSGYGAQSLYEDAAPRAEPAAPPNIYPAPAARPAEPYVAAHQIEPASAGGKSRAGSILGLPAEASRGPLVLGEPVRSKDERGIGALSHYGKPLERDGGRGGTIALLAVVLILGGGLLAYFFIPSIHAGINGWVARVRGTDVEEARREAMTPKATIYPRFNQEVIKNQVKIRGAVENRWTEPLENLTVEISLMRGDAASQVINVAVSPNPLPPNQRGTFDFEYDGKRDTGFSGYKITKLLSNGNEVKFTSPQKP